MANRRKLNVVLDSVVAVSAFLTEKTHGIILSLIKSLIGFKLT